MTKIDLSFIAMLTFIASKFFSPDVAAVVGPYVAIFIAAVGGTAVAALKAESRSRGRAYLIFFISVLIAVAGTVSISTLIAAYVDAVQSQWLFVPVAFALGFLGDKWADVLPWVGGQIASKYGALIDLLAKSKGEKP